MNEHTVKGAWKELKGQILNTWGKLADEELEKAKGNVTELTGIIEKKYGEAREQISDKLSHIMARFNAGFEETNEKLKNKSAPDDKTSDVKNTHH